MLAYHNSVFLLFVVDWFAFASGFTGRISKEMDSLLGHFFWCSQSFLGSLCFNFAILPHVLYECLSQGHQSSQVLSEIQCYIFLFQAVFIRRQYFMDIMGGCGTVISLVILIKSSLFNWIMYFSFANVFLPRKFPYIQQRLSRFVQRGSRKGMQLLL